MNVQKKSMFSGGGTATLVRADTTNLAGGLAYTSEAPVALAKFLVCGFLSNTYYANAEDQLATLTDLAAKCEPSFVACASVYAREVGKMKDMSLVGLGLLRKSSKEHYKQVFARVCSDGRMLRGFITLIRSGLFGSKNLVNSDRKLIQAWFDSRTDKQIWDDSIGNNPSIQDVVNLAHPKPNTPEKEAMLRYVMKGEETQDLNPLVTAFEQWKKEPAGALPDVPYLRLSTFTLTPPQQEQLAFKMTWNQLRQNLNSLVKKGGITEGNVDAVCEKLARESLVLRSGVLPYAIYTTLLNLPQNTTVEKKLWDAMSTALDFSVQNVPKLPENTVIAIDVSGSMGSRLSSKNVNGGISCAQVAMLMACSILKNNPYAMVLTFDTTCKKVLTLNSKDTIMTNISKIRFNGGGTDCGCAVAYVNNHSIKTDLFIMLSDSESWAGVVDNWGMTGMQSHLNVLKVANEGLKTVLIDIVPNKTQQVVGKDILCIGGFSDRVFEVVGNWVSNDSSKDFTETVRNYLTTPAQ
jgi:60 kDa SS-A/Ro ribonucleoprotein